jgi:hypothetical protein
MDRENDVLFLVLSSHGSEEPSLSVSNGLMPFAQLDGESLASALRESGVRWKVVIVSACHSGAFIAPLSGPDTIVITAAAPERTSFGCSDDRDLTYFGEAFFRDALPAAADLEAAFRTAVDQIAARERREGVEPSEPQAVFDPELLERLRALDRGPVAPALTALR